MAARSNKRVSGVFYKALKDVSAAEFLKNRPATKKSFLWSRKDTERRIKGNLSKFVIKAVIGLLIHGPFPFLPAFFRNSASSYVQRLRYFNREYNWPRKREKTKMAAKAEQKQTGFRSISASLMAPTCRVSRSQKSSFSVRKGTALVDVLWGEKHSFW